MAPPSYSRIPDDAPSSPPPRTSSPFGLPLPVTAGPSSSTSYPPPPTASRPTALERRAAKKGKGKVDDAEAAESPGGMSFSIRFTEGQEDLVDLWVGEKESVREVKRRIRFLRPSLTIDGRPRRLRLIQLGRLLTDGTFLVPWTAQLLSRRARLVRQETQGSGEALFEGALEGLEAVGREIGVSVRGEKEDASLKDVKGKGKDAEGKNALAGTEAEDNRVWLHCSVGDGMEDDEIEGERVQTTQITPLQGFDRLRDAGFSDAEIATMREEFRANAAAAPVDGDEDEHARALEDQWMEGLTAQNEAAAETSSQGVYTTLLQGVCCGFFFPFLVLFFFRTSIFSKRMQMSIVLGCCINVGFALLRAFN